MNFTSLERKEKRLVNHEVDHKKFLLTVSSIGIFGGFFGGLLGIGGSFLVIPFLIGILKLSPHKAHATALPVAFGSGASALFFYIASGEINVTISIQVMIGCLAGVMIGTKLMKFIKGKMLSFLFGIFLLLLACAYLYPINSSSLDDYHTTVFTLFSSIILGLIAGLASGLFGAGGGTIMVPGLVLLLQIGEHMAQGISLLAVIPTTILGTWLQYKENHLSMDVAPLLTLTACIGGIAGGFTAMMTDGFILRGLLVLALLYIGIQNLIKNYPGKKLSSGEAAKTN